MILLISISFISSINYSIQNNLRILEKLKNNKDEFNKEAEIIYQIKVALLEKDDIESSELYSISKINDEYYVKTDLGFNLIILIDGKEIIEYVIENN